MTVPANQDVKVSRFFSGFAETWDVLYGGRRNALWRLVDHVFRRDIYERYHLTFERLGSDLSGKTVLDVGCGSGVYCVEAARRGAAKVVGIELAEGMIKLAATRCMEAGQGRVCAFRVTGFPPDRPVDLLNETYDYAIVMGVMDYVEDAALFLGPLRLLVREFAVLSFPGKHWLRGPLRQWRYKLLGRCAVYNYDEASIRTTCQQAGFAHVDVRRVSHSGICFIVTAFT